MLTRVAGLITATICLLLSPLTLVDAQTVAGGYSHSLIVTTDGSVWAWGANSNGQLGIGNTTQQLTPVQVTSLTGVVAVAAGDYHSLALKNDGTVWAWGYNVSGQLGDGTNTQRTLPVMVVGPSNITAIAAGGSHSVALASDGTIWTWGGNTYGQLGNGSTTPSTHATVVSTGWTATAIAAGFAHTLAVRSDGTVWSWGWNSNGQLGDNSTTQRTLPVQAVGVTNAVGVAGGYCHSLVLKSTGSVVGSGCNNYGQLGDGTTSQRKTMAQGPALTGVSKITANYQFSAALTQAGELWTWGYNGSGQLGDGTTSTRVSPVRVTALADVMVIAAARSSMLAVTTAKVVYTWGANGNGQLGDGTTIGRTTPGAISDTNYRWSVAGPKFSVAAGTYYTDQTVVVTDATPGAQIHYTLDGVDPTLNDPTIASGGSLLVDHSLTLKARAWKDPMPPSDIVAATYTLAVALPTVNPNTGTYTSAQTATMSTTTPNATLRYTVDGSTPTEVSTAYTAPLLISTSTTLKVVGFRSGWSPSTLVSRTYTMNFGTLAPPTIMPAPGTYSSGATVTITAMTGATIYYTTNGTTPIKDISPVYVSPLTVATTQTVKALAAHPDYTTSGVTTSAYTIVVAPPAFAPTAGTYASGQTVIITEDTPGATTRYTFDGRDPTESDSLITSGTALFIGNYTLKARAWKTGCTTSEISSAIYQLADPLTLQQVDGGGDRSIAVQSDGLAWAWGVKPGNGSSLWSVYPVRVPSVTGAKVVAAGGSHSLIAIIDGSVYGWGANGSGQVGDGSTTDRLIPVLLPSLSNVTSVAGGGSFSVALKNDGSVWTWGANGSGQLGDGTTTNRPTPGVVPGLTSVTAIAAGTEFVLVLKTDGRVYAWGNNQNGQLGDGTTTARTAPVLVSGLTNVTAIAAGGTHALAIRNDGTLWAWGNNASGQVGDGSTTTRLAPVLVSGLPSITAIAAGTNHSLALDGAGFVWSWGANASGQLGNGSTTGRSSPGQLTVPPGVIRVGAGGSHSLAITSDGSVWTWGDNAYGQLGAGAGTGATVPIQISGPNMVWKLRPPTISPISGTYGTEQTATVTSQDVGAVLHYTTSGATPTEADSTVASGGTIPITQSTVLKVNAWKPGAPTSETTVATYTLRAQAPTFTPISGSYTGTQAVTITTATAGATIAYTTDSTEPTQASPPYTTPVQVDRSLTVKAIAFKPGWSTSDSALASYWITAGTVATPQIAPAAGPYVTSQLVTLSCATAGATIRYTLDGSEPDARSPVYRYPFVISATTTVKARAFRGDYAASAVATSVYTLDASGAAATPVLAPSGGRYAARQVVAISAPGDATLRYTTDGRDPIDTDASVGPDRTIVVDRSLVLKVRSWQAGLTPSAVRRADFLITGAVATGYAHTLALAADSSVWSWGWNNYGQLGNGTTTNQTLPVHLALTDVTAIAAGTWHSLALTRDGSVWSWGQNWWGQLGDGTSTDRSTPVHVSGLTNVVAIAAGRSHSLAITADGSLWAWGLNSSGQLGDGTTMYRVTPVRVLGLSGATAIAARDNYSAALDTHGATGGIAWTWGENISGQLGDGGSLSRAVPMRVPSLPDVVAVSPGTGWGLAVSDTGTVWVWGVDWSLLPDTYPTPSVPVATGGVNARYGAAAGGYHAIALGPDDTRSSWGGNDYGQLGNDGLCGRGITCIAAGRITMSPFALQASAGYRYSVLLHIDGSLTAFGDNTYGQLGNGTTNGASLPVAVPELTLVQNAWLASDDDADSLPAWRELLSGTDPYNSDTNGDGTPDGAEELFGRAAANQDDDFDGVMNAIERLQGTDPFNADTDGDGVVDGLDFAPLDPTVSAAPPPIPGDVTPPTIVLTEPASARPKPPGGL